jgi:hypothetical protein
MAFRSRSDTALASPRGSEPVDVVDAALALAARRGLFTADEALDLLRGVRNKIHDGPVEEAIAAIALRAEESYGTEALVDRGSSTPSSTCDSRFRRSDLPDRQVTTSRPTTSSRSSSTAGVASTSNPVSGTTPRCPWRHERAITTNRVGSTAASAVPSHKNSVCSSRCRSARRDAAILAVSMVASWTRALRGPLRIATCGGVEGNVARSPSRWY